MIGKQKYSEMNAKDIKHENGSNATSKASAASTSTYPARNIQHLHKLEKKLSSSDLHSRLKTRKVLGVGETDDGDVHRSKLSQILGHSDQLYVKLPWGLRFWQLILAFSFTSVSLWVLLLPTHIYDRVLEAEIAKYTILPVRLYGAALLGFSMFFWSSLYSSDRDVIRVSLLSSVVYFILQTIVLVLHTTTTTATSSSTILFHKYMLAFTMPSAVIGSLYYHVVGCKTMSFMTKHNVHSTNDNRNESKEE